MIVELKIKLVKHDSDIKRFILERAKTKKVKIPPTEFIDLVNYVYSGDYAHFFLVALIVIIILLFVRLFSASPPFRAQCLLFSPLFPKPKTVSRTSAGNEGLLPFLVYKLRMVFTLFIWLKKNQKNNVS